MTQLKKEKVKPKAKAKAKAVSNDTKTTTSSKTDKGVSREDLKGGLNDNLIQKLTLLDKELTEKAVNALYQYHQSTIDPKKSILGVDVPIHVQFTLERCIGVDHVKPIPVRIPYPLHKVYNGGFYNNSDEDNKDKTNDMDISNDMDDPEICLMVKDENTKIMIQELIIEFPQYMKCIKKVLTLESLRRKYKELKQKQLLCNSYTIFMSDDRIIPMLKNELGKTFLRYNKHKIPIPISITRKSTIPFAIYKSLSSTFFSMSIGGNCISIRAGTTAMSSESVVANILSITKYAIPKMPRKWSNIRAIGIQLPNSTLLPIYNKTPEQLLEIASLAGLKPNFKPMKDGDISGDNDENTLKEKKRKLLEKSKSNNPLVRALKKQKNHNGEDEANDDSISKNKKVIESISTPHKKHDDNKDSIKKKKRSLLDIETNDTKESKKQTDVTLLETKDDIAQVDDKKQILSSSKKQKKDKNDDTSKSNETDIVSTPSRNKNVLTTKTPPNTKSTPTSIAKNSNKDSIEEKSEKKSKKDDTNVPKTDETPSSKNKKKKSAGDEENNESKTNESGKKSNIKVSTPVSNVKDKKQDETPSSRNKKMKSGEESSESKMSDSGKKNKKSPTSPAVEQIMTNNKTDTPKKEKGTASFLPSNKFTGSKKGYAFKKGQNGLGYYVDKQPIVDQMAVDAIIRMASNKSSSGNRRHSSGGGGRGGGRGGGGRGGKQQNNNRRKSR